MKHKTHHARYMDAMIETLHKEALNEESMKEVPPPLTETEMLIVRLRKQIQLLKDEVDHLTFENATMRARLNSQERQAKRPERLFAADDVELLS